MKKWVNLEIKEVLNVFWSCNQSSDSVFTELINSSISKDAITGAKYDPKLQSSFARIVKQITNVIIQIRLNAIIFDLQRIK